MQVSVNVGIVRKPISPIFGERASAGGYILKQSAPCSGAVSRRVWKAVSAVPQATTRSWGRGNEDMINAGEMREHLAY